MFRRVSVFRYFFFTAASLKQTDSTRQLISDASPVRRRRRRRCTSDRPLAQSVAALRTHFLRKGAHAPIATSSAKRKRKEKTSKGGPLGLLLDCP